jgi:cytochrome P450
VIEEALRWNPPVTWMMRVAEHDTQLGGHDIPAGAIVEGCIGAANRDPARFENPDVFDPGRSPRPNLSFSVGPHFCIGAQVGRMEIDVALNRLLDRLPSLRADSSQECPQITGLMSRMPTSVPARWG